MHAYDTNPPHNDFVVNPAYPANGTAGEIISVRTKLGSRVHAWRPTAPLPNNINRRFFCHGYSLGTAMMFGYTICSDVDLLQVLADEYTKIGTVTGNGPAGVLPGDIIVWFQAMVAAHSARIILPAYVGGTNQLSDANTMVSSKTGTGVLRQNVALAVVKHDYRRALLTEIYRRTPGL
jgi:hypothetical protein